MHVTLVFIEMEIEFRTEEVEKRTRIVWSYQLILVQCIRKWQKTWSSEFLWYLLLWCKEMNAINIDRLRLIFWLLISLSLSRSRSRSRTLMVFRLDSHVQFWESEKGWHVRTLHVGKLRAGATIQCRCTWLIKRTKYSLSLRINPRSITPLIPLTGGFNLFVNLKKIVHKNNLTSPLGRIVGAGTCQEHNSRYINTHKEKKTKIYKVW